MNKILPILFLSFIFCGELEVDGDLTVTGEVQSPTIEALLAQIAVLQEQIALLQAQVNASNSSGGWETRFFDYSLNLEIGTNSFLINIEDITGFNLNNSAITLLNREILVDSGTPTTIEIFNGPNDSPYSSTHMTGGKIQIEMNAVDNRYFHINGPIYTYEDDSSIAIIKDNSNFEGLITLQLAITSQFPE